MVGYTEDSAFGSDASTYFTDSITAPSILLSVLSAVMVRSEAFISRTGRKMHFTPFWPSGMGPYIGCSKCVLPI